VLVALACISSGCERERPDAVEITLTPAVAVLDRVHRAESRPPALPDVFDAPPAGAQGAPASPMAAPAGYVMMTPLTQSTAHGEAIVLLHPSDDVVLPIFVGGTEALSIELRLEKKRFRRPLTHDLLDALSAKLGAKMLRAQVDRLEDTAFIGRVFFERGGEVIELDARPSDAIALAIGNGAPIYVSEKLLAAAGVRPRDMPDERPSEGAEPVAL
jgi:bifunctional DNase/RNase